MQVSAANSLWHQTPHMRHARDGGCVGSIANQTASRKESRVSRSPRYSNKSRIIQHAAPAGTANAPSLLLRPDDRCFCRRPRKICGSCTTTPPQLQQGPLLTKRCVSEPANRVRQSALRILQWNADRLSPKAQTMASAGEDRYLPHPRNHTNL